MDWQRLRLKWIDLFSRRRLHDDLDEEIRSHIAMDVQRRIAGGESPQTARMNTLGGLGSMDLVKENTRDVWAGNGIESLLQDIRFDVRMLSRNPASRSLSSSFLHSASEQMRRSSARSMVCCSKKFRWKSLTSWCDSGR